MSYTAFENSEYSAKPIELYKFAMGANQWLYTSSDQIFTYQEEDYLPIYIKRGGFTKGNDADKTSITLEMAASNSVASYFRTGWLAEVMIVTIIRHHVEDSEYRIIWKGRITDCRWKGSTCELVSNSVFTLFKRAGLRRVYQLGCPHMLYGNMCNVDKDIYAITGTIDDVAGETLDIDGADSYSADYFAGGMLQFGDEFRLITAHSGITVTILGPLETLVIGNTVTLWPGCNRTFDTCINKFSNSINFGGLPYLPTTNPFSGNSLV